MNHPMQTMQPGGGGGAGAYQGFQAGNAPMHPSQHTAHYGPPHMHRMAGMGGMQPGMQAGIHAAQRPMMQGGGPPGMMHGGAQPYGHAHNPMAVHSYPPQVYLCRKT